MTGQAQAALIRLHDQAHRTADNFELERIDRALDEIVRLNSPDSYGRQVRSAMANALKVIATGAKSFAARLKPGRSTALHRNAMEAVIDLRSVAARHHAHHRAAAQAADAAGRRATTPTPSPPCTASRRPRMREQISRARKAARAAYDSDMGTRSQGAFPRLRGAGERTG